MDFSKLNCSTSSYHNSTNTGPIYIFYTKKCNYFSRATRRNHSFLSKPQLKGCSDTLKLSGHVHQPVLYSHNCDKNLVSLLMAVTLKDEKSDSHLCCSDSYNFIEYNTPTIVSHKTPLICTLSSTCSWIECNF